MSQEPHHSWPAHRASPAPGPQCPRCPHGVSGQGLMCGFCSPGNKTEKSIPVKAQGPSSVQLADLTPGMMYKLWVFPIWSHPSEHSYITFTTSSGETGIVRVSPECPWRVPSVSLAWPWHGPTIPMELWSWMHGNPPFHRPQLSAFLNPGLLGSAWRTPRKYRDPFGWGSLWMGMPQDGDPSGWGFLGMKEREKSTFVLSQPLLAAPPCLLGLRGTMRRHWQDAGLGVGM